MELSTAQKLNIIKRHAVINYYIVCLVINSDSQYVQTNCRPQLYISTINCHNGWSLSGWLHSCIIAKQF